MVFSLKEIIEIYNNDKTSVEEVLSTFTAADTESKCDVENFLINKAFDMEKLGQSATYIISNDEEFEKGNLVIEGYFTLALKAFHFCDTSKRRIKKITGKGEKYVPAYLIGQLAKREGAPHGIGGKFLLFAIDYIKEAIKIVGGRLIYIECKDSFVSYYKRQGFTLLQRDNETELNQLYLAT